MRLSARGIAFACVGAAAICAAYLLNIPPLRAVGVLLLVLPAASLLTLVGRKAPLRVEGLHFDDGRGSAALEDGAQAGCRFSVRTTAPTPIGSTLLVSADPALADLAGRTEIPPLAAGVAVARTLEVRPGGRGRYRLGPITARRTGMVGLARADTQCVAAREVLVGPRLFDVPALRRTVARSSGVGEKAARTGTDVSDFTTRPYERGDDLRKVHWVSTARRGELMVRQDADTASVHAVVLLDTYGPAYAGRQHFEWAVCAAAAAVTAATAAGYDVEVITQRDRIGCVSSKAASPAGSCLALFADVCRADSLAGPGPGPLGGAGVITAVTGASRFSAARLAEIADHRGEPLRLAVGQSRDAVAALADHRFTAAVADPYRLSVTDAWNSVLTPTMTDAAR